MESRSLETVEGIKLLARVRPHIRVYQETSVPKPATDAVIPSDEVVSSSQTVPTTLVVCGVIGVATTIAIYAAQRAYFETVYEANHPQLIFSLKGKDGRHNIKCVNFSTSSFDLLLKTAKVFGIHVNFTSNHLTHYSTAGKSYFRSTESSNQGYSSIYGEKMKTHKSERKETISKWAKEDWRGSSSGGGRLANDCRLRVLEAHRRFAIDEYLKLKGKTKITSNDEMGNFQEMYEDLKLPFSPCLTEAVRVLIDGADPDVFLSLDAISTKCKGKCISIHHTVALSTDGTSTKVFSSVLQGKVTDKWLKEIRSTQTSEQQTKPLPFEVLFEPSANSFFPSVFGTSCHRKELIHLNNILRYVYFNCHYDGLEDDERSIIDLEKSNLHITGSGNFWKKFTNYIFPNFQRRDRIISELFHKSVTSHSITEAAVHTLGVIMGWNCLSSSNESITQKINFPFLSLRYVTYLKLMLHLQYGHQLDPPVHSLFEWVKYIATKSTSKYHNALNRAWISRHLPLVCSRQRLGSAPYSGSFEVTINFLTSHDGEKRVRRFFNESGREAKVKAESSGIVCSYLQEGTVQGVVLSSVEMFQILFVVGLNPTTFQIKLSLPLTNDVSQVNFISEKALIFDKGMQMSVSKLVNVTAQESAEFPFHDPSHPLCHKRGICPISDSDSRNPIWKSDNQYFEAVINVELTACNEGGVNVTDVVEKMWSDICIEKGSAVSFITDYQKHQILNIKVTDFEHGFTTFLKEINTLLQDLKCTFGDEIVLVNTSYIIFEQPSLL